MSDNTTPWLIATSLSRGLRRKLDRTELEAYPSIAKVYVEGMGDRAIQVVPGSAAPDGKGKGAQEGGGVLLRRQNYTLAVWLRMNMDAHGYSEQVLLDASQGMLLEMERIRQVFSNTLLGVLLFEPMRYESETATVCVDPEQGVFVRDIVFSTAHAVEIPNELTLTEADLTD